MAEPARRQMNLASDNTAGAAPAIMAALAAAVSEPAMPYGDDDCSRRLVARASEVFEREVVIHPVATGTAANALALATVSPPYGVVFCHEAAHIEEDECAAPEFYMGGGKLSLLSGDSARLSAAALEEKLSGQSPAPPVHHAQPAAVSISQASELGTLYTPAEIHAISRVCRAHDLALHMDGARIANAVAALGVTPAEATWKAGVDVLSLGATKNGALAAEAVVFFNPDLAGDFEFRRKRGGHLFSKMRVLSAQLLAYLEEGRWLDYAAQANRMADALAEGLRGMPNVVIEAPVETNMIFLTMPEVTATALQTAGCAFYCWGARDGRISARLVTSFATTPEDITYFLAIASADHR